MARAAYAASKPARISLARRIAFRVLEDVSGGAFASDQLRAATARIDSRDAGLAHEIVFGCLRHQAQLDYLADHYAGRPLKLSLAVRIALRIGLFQLRYLDRIPRHAAVGESVELAKQAGERSAGGMVNAVLRKAGASPVPWPSDPVRLSIPQWLLDRWTAHYGAEAAAGIANAALERPETYIRVPPGVVPEGLDAEPQDPPGCWRLRSGGPGPFRIHDAGSQSVVPLLDLRPGLRLLDLCAAPGNKTAQALESGAHIVASDREPWRLRALDGLPVPRVVLDGTASLPFRIQFDRILIDAPCSGTGTLGRNPEIKWRLHEADLRRYQQRQRAMLQQALPFLAAGGRLVYSTCSLEAEENEEVVSAYRPVETMLRLPGRQPGDGFFAAVLAS